MLVVAKQTQSNGFALLYNALESGFILCPLCLSKNLSPSQESMSHSSDIIPLVRP